MKTLTLSLKRKWFDMIKSGEKKEEYRDGSMSFYWANRLRERTKTSDGWKYGDFKHFDRLVFTLGYPKAGDTERRLRRALWLARAERYKMKEFIAREEGNLSNQMSWSRVLRERIYNQWVDQLLRIANLANKLQNKCRAKAEEYK